ncbi:MAG: S9 family peptidase [Clostridia bacterium]
MRRLETNDLYRYRWISDAQISPNGDRVAYVVTRVREDETGYESSIWMVPTSGGSPRRLTRGSSDTRPRWSPDGRRIAFLSRRETEEDALWCIDPDQGEAFRIAQDREGVVEFSWSPQGDRLAYTRRLGPGGEEMPADEDDTVVLIRTMSYKFNGRGFIHERFSHIFVVDAGGGEEVRITHGDYDHTDPVWLLGGERVACVCVRCDDPGYADGSDVYVFPADGSAVKENREPLRITRGPGPISDLSPSPTGQEIAYIGHDNARYGATLPGVWVTSLDDGSARRIIDEDSEAGTAVGGDCRYGHYPQRPVWDDAGRHLHFVGTKEGVCNLLRAATDEGAVSPEEITDRQWTVTGLSGTPGADAFALIAEDSRHPGEVWFLRPGDEPSRLTDHNGYLAEMSLSSPREIEFRGAEDRVIQGWVLDPVGEVNGGTPLILQIHGGPHAAYGHGFYHEFHCLAARDYAVLFVNPHGSRGYGADFNAATHHDWGGKDYLDLMAAVDYCLGEGKYDSARLGVGGGSFGGFMTNWIVGHEDRFSAAVTQRSSCNRYSMFGNSDLGYRHGEWEFPGYPWENPDGYLKRSPISYVDRVNTPMLIIHSENDLRCPIGQGEEWFTALKRLGKEAVFARFPEENHELSRSGRPDRRLRRLDLIVEWFEDKLEGRDRS